MRKLLINRGTIDSPQWEEMATKSDFRKLKSFEIWLLIGGFALVILALISKIK